MERARCPHCNRKRLIVRGLLTEAVRDLAGVQS